MRKSLPILFALIAGLTLGVLCANAYWRERGRLAALRAAIDETWAAVVPQLAERAKLARGVARTTGASDLYDYADAVRKAEARPDLIAAHEMLTTALAGLEVEGEDVARLQNQIADAENRIAQERRRYNQAVQDYNTAIQLFPANLVARVAGFSRESSYFRSTEADRQADPPVRFAPEHAEPQPEGVQ